MCGIFGYIGKNKTAGKIIVEGLKSLEYRGYDSWGVALKKSDSSIYVEKHVGKIKNHSVPQNNSSVGIGHTRWATHGGVTVKNAHPHTNKERNICVVHNGIVENYEKHKKNLQKKGYKFETETDTEVLAYLATEYIKTQKNKIRAIQKLFTQLDGLNAVIFFFKDTEEFIAVKNGSPLVFAKNNNGYYLASDATALRPYSDMVYFLEDNDLLYFNKDTFSVFSNGKKQKNTKFTKLSFDTEDTKLGTHPHFMIKEILEQPAILENTLITQEENIKKASRTIKKAYGTYLIGSGTSSYACLAGTYLFSKIAKKHINFSIGSEFSYLIDFLKPTSLVIPLSQSGETIDVIAAVKKAKEKKAKVLTITNVLGSTLYRMADSRLLLNAGPEKCVLATKSFTTKIALLYLLAYSQNNKYSDGARELKKAITQVKLLIGKRKKIQKLADKLKSKKHIYILGRGVSYPTALESALKIKEVSYIHAEGFAGGELKHGVIALIEKGTPVIIYNPEDETYDETLASAHEVKARGAYVIGVSSKKNDIFDEFIEVKNCGDATLIPNVVVAQLLGYYLALALKNDPDKPRNLAKSVTVK